MSELLSRGLNAVAVVIGSDESIITCQNTLNTLKSLEGVAQKTNTPVVMYYEHNNRKRSEVDNVIKMVLGTLGILSSRQNRALDSADLTNWVRFNKTTVLPAQLAQFDVFGDLASTNEVKDPIAVVGIYKDEDSEHTTLVPEYSATGYMTEIIDGIDSLHFVVTIDKIPALYNAINDKLNKYLNNRDSRVSTARILTKDDSTTDSGLVL